MEDAIQQVLDKGLTIYNNSMGYITKQWNGSYLFMDEFNDPHHGTFSAVIGLFLKESRIKKS